MSRRVAVGGQRGFTLAEMLVVTAVLGIIFAGVLAGLQVGVASSRVGTGRADAQSAARVGLDRIMRDIRSAGVDPTSNAFTATAVVSTAQSSQIVLNSDLDGSGAAVAPGLGTCDPAGDSEVVQYRVVANELRRSTNPASGGCEAALVGLVQGLTFQYLAADGTAPANNAAITTVVVTLTIAPEQVTGAQTGAMVVTMTDQARIRNR
jgi:prepilin-type N-terminal cleavage/methylation domain-containing protein